MPGSPQNQERDPARELHLMIPDHDVSRTRNGTGCGFPARPILFPVAPDFHSPYQGKTAFSPEAQDATSRVLDALHRIAR